MASALTRQGINQQCVCFLMEAVAECKEQEKSTADVNREPAVTI